MSDFDGSTYVPEFDRERLNAQQLRVFSAMLDGNWRTLSEIRNRIASTDQGLGRNDPEASISARLRDLRKRGLTVERRRRGDPKAGLFEYRVLAVQAVAW